MPTSVAEAKTIHSIINEYLTPEQAQEVTKRLNEEVGKGTTNSSLKISLEMLEALYNEQGKRKLKHKYLFLCGVITFHYAVIVFNALSVIALPFLAPWYIAFPIITLIVNIMYSPTPCPLTRLENKLRYSLGMPEIKHFVGHYIVWPMKKRLREKRP